MRRILSAIVMSTALTVAAVPFVGVSPAFASGSSVTNASVSLSNYQAGHQAVTYTFGFTTTTALSHASGDTISVTTPAGTTLSSAQSDYQVNGSPPSSITLSGVNNNGTINGNNNAVVIGVPADIAANSPVVITIANVTNPLGGTYTDQLSTSRDTASVNTNAYVITTVGTSVTGVTANDSNHTAGAKNVTYTIGFTATSGLTANLVAPSKITLAFPGDTSFGSGTAYTVNGASASGTASGNTVVVTVPASSPPFYPPIAAGSPVTVVVMPDGSSNPGPSNDSMPGTYQVLVSTTQDTAPVYSTSYTLFPAPTSVSNGIVTVTPNSAGSVAQYNISFTTSSTGQLAAGSGTITFTAPGGTSFPTTSADYTVNGTTVTAPVAVSSGGTTVTFTTPVGIPSGATPRVVVVGVINPPANINNTMAISTSSDTAPVASGPYTIGPGATSVSGVTVDPGMGAVGGGTSNYTVKFTIDTGLSGSAGDSITLTAPAGTTFPSGATAYTVNGTTELQTAASANTVTITLNPNQSFPAQSAVTVVATGVTNPPAGTSYRMTVVTSQDTAPAQSAPYSIGSATTAVTGVTASPSPTGAGQKASYTIGFTTSASGALAKGSGTITVVAPAGTVFPLTASDYTVNGVTTTATPTQTSANNVTITVPADVAPSTHVSVVAAQVTNPAANPNDTLTVNTSADTAPVTSNSYAITTPAAPTVTGVSPNSGPDTGGTGVSVTGTGFTGATGVNFGTVSAANFVVVSDTTITVNSPAASAPGPVDVTVTTQGGTSATSSSDTFTYVAGTGYTPESPQRILDTRPGSGHTQNLSSPLPAGSTDVVQVTGLANVPSGATAVALNATAVGPTRAGNLRVFPDGAALPNASTINYQPGDTTANAVIVKLPADGKVDVYTAGSSVDVVLDVVGFFGSTANYVPQTPSRTLDTRPGNSPNQGITGPLAARTVYAVPVAGQGSPPVPSNATSVAINVTAVGPTQAGNLRVYPDTNGQGTTTPPNASTINYTPGVDQANFVVVQLPADGKIDLYSATSGTVNVLFDVVGYFTSTTTYVPQSPARTFDSEPGYTVNSAPGPLTGRTVYPVAIAGAPAGATAVALNVTAINPNAVGNLRVFPDGQPVPNASTINYIPGEDTANFVIVQLPSNDKIDLYSSTNGSVNVAVDVVGFFPAGSG